jgi:hypothetical protein
VYPGLKERRILSVKNKTSDLIRGRQKRKDAPVKKTKVISLKLVEEIAAQFSPDLRELSPDEPEIRIRTACLQGQRCVRQESAFLELAWEVAMARHLG